MSEVQEELREAFEEYFGKEKEHGELHLSDEESHLPDDDDEEEVFGDQPNPLYSGPDPEAVTIAQSPTLLPLNFLNFFTVKYHSLLFLVT